MRPSGVFAWAVGLAWVLVFGLAACRSELSDQPAPPPGTLEAPGPTPPPSTEPTPVPTRAIIGPGQRLPYVVQTGDTALAIAAHFNTSVEELLRANPSLAADATLTPGRLIEVPAYYFPLGGPAFQIIPDSEFVYGPGAVGFDLADYLRAQPGFLPGLSAYAAQRQRDSAGVIQYVAEQYSLNPRLLLALMEWRSGALSRSDASDDERRRPLGHIEGVTGFYSQLLWAAEQLSHGYYGWRNGTLTEIPLSETYRSRVDMYQNAGTVGVQYLLGQLVDRREFEAAAGSHGFARTYYALWGNPFVVAQPPEVIPGDLVQPDITLPFAPNQEWSLTGGPHPGWGTKLPWSALDFGAPGVAGCNNTERWFTAPGPGVIVRSQDHTVVLDLDGDGLEQTGWVLFFFHVADLDRIARGRVVQTGDRLGHPSCEGGTATGTHVHIARKFNGEWLPADGIVPGVVPFVLGGWTPQRGQAPYQGRLVRLGAWVEACTCSTAANKIYWQP